MELLFFKNIFIREDLLIQFLNVSLKIFLVPLNCATQTDSVQFDVDDVLILKKLKNDLVHIQMIDLEDEKNASVNIPLKQRNKEQSMLNTIAKIASENLFNKQKQRERENR